MAGPGAEEGRWAAQGGRWLLGGFLGEEMVVGFDEVADGVGFVEEAQPLF